MSKTAKVIKMKPTKVSVGKKKFTQLMKKIQKLSPARQKYWLELLKTIRDSSISKELGDDADNVKELQTKLNALITKKYGANGWKKAFTAYDKDKDGNISSVELDRILSDAGVGNAFTRGTWVSGVLEKLDKNKNSKIAYSELSPVIVAQSPTVVANKPATGKVIQMPTTTIVGNIVQPQRDWLLDTANWFDRVYESAGKSLSTAGRKLEDFQLGYVNQLDKVYTAVSDEVAKVPQKTGKAIGDLTGTDYWAYIIGAGAALVGIYYLSSVMPRR